jgi:hypothetical protein
MASTSATNGKKGKKSVPVVVVEETPTVENSHTTTEVDSLKTLVEELTKRLEELETTVSTLKSTQLAQSVSTRKTDTSPAKPEKKTRAPTAYNVFMKEKMSELKTTHPDVTNIERMRLAAAAWSEIKATTGSASA